MSSTRRDFMRGALLTIAGSTLPLLASIPPSRQNDPTLLALDAGWEYYQGPLDPRFQVWHSEEITSWQPVTLPHCFNHYDACDPDTAAYRGPGWYRRTLALANPYPNGRTLLHFEAAGQSSQIYIGATLIAGHNGGYDEFMVDITDATAGQSQVQLAVLCDNSRDLDRMPSDLSDFTLYGGLYRHVHLVYVPAVSLEAVHTEVTITADHSALVEVTARLYAPATPAFNVTLNLEITDPRNSVIHTHRVERHSWSGEALLASIPLSSPHLWSPEHPELYRCQVTLSHGSETVHSIHRFGVRHTRWEEYGPFFLNGERLFLRGTQRHEDHSQYAAAMPDDLIRRELQLIRDMGANFLRLAHYQQSRLVLDLCDELGILVWEEVPWVRSGVVGALFQQRGKAQLTNMIDQHRNHPSVLLWGLGNEDDWPGEVNGTDQAGIRAYMSELNDLAHHLDPTRVTSYRRCDFARDIPDVYSPSIWAGWYSGSYTEYRAALEKARPTVKHLLHIEWGADSHAGRHAEEPDPMESHVPMTGHTAETGLDYKLTGGKIRMAKDGGWTETYACELFDWYLKTQEELPWLAGAAQWIFKDFTTPLRVENPVPRVNQKGLLTRDMKPKEGYFVFQSYWASKPMLHLYGHSWPVRWGKPGQPRMVRVYSNCREVELFLNGMSCGIRHRDPQDFPAAGLRWNLPFGPGRNQLRAVSRGSGLPLEDLISFDYETRSWGQPTTLSLTRTAQRQNQTTCQLTLLDSNGVPCLDARNVVRFSLAGAGRLIDNLGTPTGSRVVELYNGRAEITLEHTTSVTLAANIDQLPEASLSILPSGVFALPTMR